MEKTKRESQNNLSDPEAPGYTRHCMTSEVHQRQYETGVQMPASSPAPPSHSLYARSKLAKKIAVF